MDFVEKRTRELMEQARKKAKEEEQKAYSGAWKTIAGCMGDDLAEKVLEIACDPDLKTHKERVAAAKSLLQKNRFGFFPVPEPKPEPKLQAQAQAKPAAAVTPAAQPQRTVPQGQMARPAGVAGTVQGQAQRA